MIELLIASAVLIVLMAVLLPTIHTAQARARRIACVSSQRQILMAMISYSADNNGSLPTQAKTTFPYTDWSARLTNYFSGNWGLSNPDSRCIFTCPEDKNERKSGTAPYSWKRFWRSYAVNGTNTWSEGYHVPWSSPEETPMKLGQVPAHVILIGENHGIDGATGPGTSGAYVEVSEMESLQGHASAMHRDNGPLGIASTDNSNGGGNYGFADGRVEFHLRDEFNNETHVGVFNGGANDPWKWL
jgi:prepilin-type processing-associated H-X9-DG protein